MIFVSNAIHRAEYDDNTSTLHLWFVQTGGPYSYYRVPPHVYAGLCKASSKGSYFNDHIRERYGR